MSIVVLLGYIAAILTSLSFLPQALLVIRTRQTSGISLAMYSLFTLGVAFWLIYGIASKAMPIIAANAVTLALAATILSIAVKERLKARRAASALVPVKA
jgi:MtN3 and saliva related transmembrane protein